jgi:hypothetical protein
MKRRRGRTAGRGPTQRVEQAAQALLSPDERVTSTGSCWAVQVRGRVPLLLLARQKYVMALTDRRILVFARGRGKPEPSDLVIGKRYESFSLARVRRRRPLLQMVLQATNGNRLVFEFRRNDRELAGELIARLTPPPGPVATEAGFGAPRSTDPTTESRSPFAPGPVDPVPVEPAPVEPVPAWPVVEPSSDTPEDPAFWGSEQ